MDKISIDILFPSKNNNHGSIDINTLINPKNNIQNEKFSIDNLLQTKKDKRKRVLNNYYKLFKRCLSKINYMNKFGTCYTIFEVPFTIFGCVDFNYTECLDFIDYKLKKLNIDTLKLSSNSLYISWSCLEEKLNK